MLIKTSFGKNIGWYTLREYAYNNSYYEVMLSTGYSLIHRDIVDMWEKGSVALGIVEKETWFGDKLYAWDSITFRLFKEIYNESKLHQIVSSG
jgi:hypothetical protein